MLWCLSAERAVAPLVKCGLRIRASFNTSMKLESCPAKSYGLQADKSLTSSTRRRRPPPLCCCLLNALFLLGCCRDAAAAAAGRPNWTFK